MSVQESQRKEKRTPNTPKVVNFVEVRNSKVPVGHEANDFEEFKVSAGHLKALRKRRKGQRNTEKVEKEGGLQWRR